MPDIDKILQMFGGTFLWPRLSQWSSEGVSVCPTSVNTTFDRVVGQSGNSRPFSQCVRDALHRQAMISAGIVGLGDLCGPSAILRAVSLRVIDPIKRMARGTIAHIRVEVFKKKPAVAYRDASTPVGCPRPSVAIAASVDHPSPLAVDARMGHAVLGRPLSASFRVEAAATARQSFTQTSSNKDFSCSAFAAAQPVGAFTLLRSSQWLWGAFDHRQTAKHYSRQINRS